MLWRLLRMKRRTPDPYLKDKQELLEEIQVAQTEWQHALGRLDYALGQDQVDYAIFALEAAEKRYEMLLKNAKHLDIHVLHVGSSGKAAEV